MTDSRAIRDRQSRQALRQALEALARDLPDGADGHIPRLVVRVPADADAPTLGTALRRALPGSDGTRAPAPDRGPAAGKGEGS